MPYPENYMPYRKNYVPYRVREVYLTENYARGCVPHRAHPIHFQNLSRQSFCNTRSIHFAQTLQCPTALRRGKEAVHSPYPTALYINVHTNYGRNRHFFPPYLKKKYVQNTDY